MELPRQFLEHLQWAVSTYSRLPSITLTLSTYDSNTGEPGH